MKTNLKVILSSVGIAAVLASPAMAKQMRPHNAAAVTLPSDARGSVAPNATNEGGPYTPSAPTRPYSSGKRDFQGGGGNY
jgi:hypothetical protein